MIYKIKSNLPVLLLIPAIFSLFWPIFFNPLAILFPTFSSFSDLMVIHWPKAHLMIQNWRQGQGLPYWSPLTLSGMPLAANQLAMLFYPPAWLFLIIPPELTFNLLFLFHFLVGGVGVYFLLREYFNLSPLACLLGSLTFTLNGKWLAHAAGGHVSMVGAIAWLPWAVLGVHMLFKAQPVAKFTPTQVRWAILVIICLALQIVTHTLPVIYTVYLGLAIALGSIFYHPIGPEHRQIRAIRIKSGLHKLILLVLIFILAGLLAAVQLLPLVELAQLSNRALSLDQASEFALSPAQLLVGLLLPSAQADHELIIYAGLLPLLLAPLGLTRQNRWSWFYGLLCVFVILFALGPHNPLHALFYYVVPGFRWVRTPARLFFVGALALSILVGLGTEQLAHRPWSPSAKKWLQRVSLVLAPLALFLGLGLAFTLGQSNPAFRPALALALFIPSGLGLILGRAYRLLAGQSTLILLGCLLFLDLAWFDSTLLRFVTPAEAFKPGQPAAVYLAQQPAYFRVYSPSYSLPLQTAAATGLSLADGVEPVHVARYDQFMARAGGYNDPNFSVTIPKFDGPLESALKNVQPNLKLLGLLNVTYLASSFPIASPELTLETKIDDDLTRNQPESPATSTYIYRNRLSLPRAWVAHQTIPAEADWLAQLAALPNPGDVVMIENELGVNHPLGYSSARITAYSANQIELTTQIGQPGWLVVSEIWYPGWQALVNGTPQPVERVNGLLRGVYLTAPGDYQIHLTYRPTSVFWGGWISAGAWVGLIGLGLGAGWPKKP
jgi:hypothetical protein